jgi:hypothetical protein
MPSIPPQSWPWLPDPQSLGSPMAWARKGATGNQMALDVEGVVGGGMHRNSEPLRANLVSVTMPNGALGYLQKLIMLV